MATTRSVHFVDSGTISKQIFAPTRYNLPLFLCQKLQTTTKAAPKKRSADKANEAQLSSLLERMRKYHVEEKSKDSNTAQRKQSVNGSSRFQYRQKWPRCAAPLRDSRKDWFLPPGRYRLGGSVADSVNISTGGGRQPSRIFKGSVRTGPKPPHAFHGGALLSEDTQAAPTATEVHSARPVRCEINVPAEMNKLSHPRKHFVGKIRPGDRMNERATSRLAVSEPTVCHRNPGDPGPGHYDIIRASSPAGPSAGGGKRRPTAVCGYTYDRYRREPFSRPPPGRYDLRAPLPPLPPPTGRPRFHGDRIRIPLVVSCVAGGHLVQREAAAATATLRLNSINIPVRPRKGRRSRKVAFLSGSARFRDREFFPIGGLSSRTVSTGQERRGRGQRQSVTSKRSEGDGQREEERKDGAASRDGDCPRSERPEPASTGKAIEEIIAARLTQRMVEEWQAAGWQLSGGISRPGPPTRGQIPTKFFTVPSLERR